MPRLLLIEDDSALNDTVSFFLGSNGVETDGVTCAEDAYALMERNSYDIVVSDVMLPGEDGFRVAETLRSCDPKLPIILLTALDDLSFKERGYSLGIDDYLTKPVDLNEMLWHINALLRRAGINREMRITVGDLTLDGTNREASAGGAELPLTKREFDILFFLLSYPDKVFTRGALMERFWDDSSESTLRSVDVYITKIRDKTKDCDGFEIRTVRGLGYKAVILREETA
ncbi:MAG: response regulator transcription factor [Clostridia bacterium]|nr:response regulator transcription factor [Clostridia bacterium]